MNYGDSGTGKSYNSRLNRDVNSIYTYIPGNGKNSWWDGYDPRAHTTVIIDEYNGSLFSKDKFKQLIDKYPINVEIKDSTLPFIPEYIYINSNKSPLQLYSNLNEKEQIGLIRRFKEINWYSGDTNENVEITNLLTDPSVLENDKICYTKVK